MSEKELLYYEDAIGHESNIIKIIDNNIVNLSDKELISFMENERLIHEELKNNLMNILKEKANG